MRARRKERAAADNGGGRSGENTTHSVSPKVAESMAAGIGRGVSC